jgi:hypothetical protein
MVKAAAIGCDLLTEATGGVPSATVPGQPATVQVMVKDACRYASNGGLGSGRLSMDNRPMWHSMRPVSPVTQPT